MSGIYLKDLLPNKRSSADLESILRDIIPDYPPTNPIICTEKGFRLNFPNENDANSFFNTEVYRKLCQASLDPQFSHATANLREVIVPNIPYEIYLKSEADLLTQLNEENNFIVIHIIKFTGRSNTNRFFRIFLNCNESQISLISANKLKLSSHIFRAEAVKNRPKFPTY